MKRLLKLASMLILLAGLAGCNSSLLKPSTVTFTAAEFQAALVKKFPVEKQYLGLVKLTVSNPQVSMRPAIKHIALQFDADMATFGSSREFKGKLNITTSLAYDAATRSIVLKDPQLEKMDVDGMSADRTQELVTVAGILINETLQGASIYTFNPDDLHFIGMKLEPESIEITDDGVVVHIAK
ncbi:MAG: DUF1439 domain-containing protein [Sulfuriferula sp.]|nr:DUF1439 domain-containing protein [Sulfuriferula sp.]